MTNPTSYTDEQVREIFSTLPGGHSVVESLLADRQRLQAEVEAKDARLGIALRAVEHAETVMSYCSGDAWERECTEKDREAFDELYAELFPPAAPQPPEGKQNVSIVLDFT